LFNLHGDSMAAEDYFEWYFDPLDDEYEQDIQCKYCKNYGFHWELTDRGWRLHTETGKLHTCKAHPINNKS